MLILETKLICLYTCWKFSVWYWINWQDAVLQLKCWAPYRKVVAPYNKNCLLFLCALCKGISCRNMFLSKIIFLIFWKYHLCVEKKSCNSVFGRTHDKQINMVEHVCLITAQLRTIAKDDRAKDVTKQNLAKGRTKKEIRKQSSEKGSE